MEHKKPIVVILLLLLTICACACTNQSGETSGSDSKDKGLYTVADNMSLKEGTESSGETILESDDFAGFSCRYDEASQEYLFMFKLTDEGQEKMAGATSKFAENSGSLSLWVGDELIVSPQIMEPITGDEFVVNMVDLSKENVAGFVDKLEGK